MDFFLEAYIVKKIPFWSEQRNPTKRNAIRLNLRDLIICLCYKNSDCPVLLHIGPVESEIPVKILKKPYIYTRLRGFVVQFSRKSF